MSAAQSLWDLLAGALVLGMLFCLIAQGLCTLLIRDRLLNRHPLEWRHDKAPWRLTYWRADRLRLNPRFSRLDDPTLTGHFHQRNGWRLAGLGFAAAYLAQMFWRTHTGQG